jgi:hypothetical protein
MNGIGNSRCTAGATGIVLFRFSSMSAGHHPQQLSGLERIKVVKDLVLFSKQEDGFKKIGLLCL